MADRSPIVTVTEAARLLGVSRWTVYRAIERGELESFKLGGCLRLRRAEIERVIHGGRER